VLSAVRPEEVFLLEKRDDLLQIVQPSALLGRDTNRILEDLMGVAERPIEIKRRPGELFRLIDKGELEAARETRRENERQIGADDPELVRADVLMRRREIPPCQGSCRTDRERP
jgi:hypothetical protein